MKFLENAPLSRLNAFLDNVNIGDYVVHGCLEAYSCKLAGIDKKLSRSLEQEVVTMMAASPSSLSVSPVGPLTDSSSRKTLIYLILTLNHMYPDYDFSNLRAHHFTKESGIMPAKDNIDSLLLESAKVWEATVGGGNRPLQQEMWQAIDDVIGLIDCDVYVYKAVAEGDPFCDDGNLWMFNYFFYNKKLKRILYFSCHATSKTANDESDVESDEDHGTRYADDEYGIDDSFVDDMDI